MNNPSNVRDNFRRKAVLALLLLTLMLVLVQSTAGGSGFMEQSNGYSLPHYNLSASSAAWTGGGGYTGNSAVGQHEGGSAAGGGFSLVGGVLAGVGQTGTQNYLPLVVR